MEWGSKPLIIEVQKGEKRSFCSCGQSKNPPYCDGAHKGTGLGPHRVIFEEDQKVAICMCGRSQKLPYCDGAHRCAQ